MEEATTQENLDYDFVSPMKYFVVPYISACPQIRYHVVVIDECSWWGANFICFFSFSPFSFFLPPCLPSGACRDSGTFRNGP